MKMEWNKFIGKTLNVTMFENYGLINDPANDAPIYEIVFKTGKLSAAYDDGLLLETQREEQKIKIFISHNVIKCVEIFDF